MKLNLDGIGDSRAEKRIYLHFFFLPLLPCCAFSSACVIWTIWYGWLKGFEIFNSFIFRAKLFAELGDEWNLRLNGRKKVLILGVRRFRFCLKFAFKEENLKHYLNYKISANSSKKLHAHTNQNHPKNKHKRISEKSIKITAINSKGLTALNPLKNPKSFVTINFYKTSDFSKLHINIHLIVFRNQNDYDAQ